jgi:TctA family transporter
MLHSVVAPPETVAMLRVARSNFGGTRKITMYCSTIRMMVTALIAVVYLKHKLKRKSSKLNKERKRVAKIRVVIISTVLGYVQFTLIMVVVFMSAIITSLNYVF